MKSIFMLILVFTHVCAGGEKPKRSVAQDHSNIDKFKLAAGIKPGEYEDANDTSEKCPAGILRIFELDGGISVMIGADLLFSGAKIDRNKLEFQERECTTNQTVTQNSNIIESKKEQKCKNVTYTYSTHTKFVENKIEYKLETFTDTKRQLSLSCTLEKKNDALF